MVSELCQAKVLMVFLQSGKNKGDFACIPTIFGRGEVEEFFFGDGVLGGKGRSQYLECVYGF